MTLVAGPHFKKSSSVLRLNEENVVNEPTNPVENPILNNGENRLECKDKNNPMIKQPSRLTSKIPEEGGRNVREMK